MSITADDFPARRPAGIVISIDDVAEMVTVTYVHSRDVTRSLARTWHHIAGNEGYGIEFVAAKRKPQ